MSGKRVSEDRREHLVLDNLTSKSFLKTFCSDFKTHRLHPYFGQKIEGRTGLDSDNVISLPSDT